MRRLLVGYVVLALAGCKADGTTSPVENPPPPPPPLTGKKQLKIVAGEGATDTARSPVSLPALTVEVRGDDSLPVAGALVRFTSIPPTDTLRKYEAGMYVCPLTVVSCVGTDPYYSPPSTFATATTSSDGRASVLVGFGTFAGNAGIGIEVPSLQLKDTAYFTVLPGNPARVLVFPRDTALQSGRTYTVRASVVDRYGNPRTEPVTVSVSNSAVATVAGKTVTAHSLGRSGILVSAASLPVDSTSVYVVPPGTVAWGGSGIAIADFDGSGQRKLTAVGYVPTWVPGDNALIYATGEPYGPTPHLAIVDFAGNVTNIPYSAEVTSAEYYPRISPDGVWIYFSGRTIGQDGTWQLYRMRRDFTDLEMLSPDGNATDWRADISPDGSRLVYVSTRAGNVGIRVMNLATRTSVHLTSYAQSPVWSPNGQQIAFVNGGLFVINPDGTGLRRVSPPGLNYSETVDWSADGQWLVASRGGVVIVNVTTGMELRTSASFTSAGAAVKR